MRNQLSYKQILALAKYLETNHDRIRAERPSHVAVARQASAELGFECSEHNVRAAAEAGALAWTPRRTGNGARNHASRILARSVLEIADALDIKVDQDVHRIAMGRGIGNQEVSADTQGTHA